MSSSPLRVGGHFFEPRTGVYGRQLAARGVPPQWGINMSKEELHETLSNLHETLSDESEVDDESRKLLLEVMDDIRRLLSPEQQPQDADDSLSEQITDRLRDFNIEHPIIGGLVQRLSDGLANMGI